MASLEQESELEQTLKETKHLIGNFPDDLLRKVIFDKNVPYLREQLKLLIQYSNSFDSFQRVYKSVMYEVYSLIDKSGVVLLQKSDPKNGIVNDKEYKRAKTKMDYAFEEFSNFFSNALIKKMNVVKTQICTAIAGLSEPQK